MLKKYGVFIMLGVLLLSAIVLKRFGGKLPAFESASEPETESAQVEAELVQTAEQSSGKTNYFDDFRTERESVRDREMQYLDEIIATGNIDAETLEEAVEQKLALVENMEKEFTVENMITAKGFKDAAVTFHNGSVNVVVGKEALSEAEVAQILDIVCRETGESAQNVKISSGGYDAASY